MPKMAVFPYFPRGRGDMGAEAELPLKCPHCPKFSCLVDSTIAKYLLMLELEQQAHLCLYNFSLLSYLFLMKLKTCDEIDSWTLVS